MESCKLTTRGYKNGVFDQYLSALYFENATRYCHFYHGRRMETRICDLTNGAISNDFQ